MNIDNSIVLIIIFGGLGLLMILRGLITIYKREGPLMVKGKKPIVKGKYAVMAGIGQIIVAVAFLIIAFYPHLTLYLCALFAFFLVLGTTVHFASGFGDPDARKEIQKQQDELQKRDNDPVIIKKRTTSVVLYVTVSLVLGGSVMAVVLFSRKDLIDTQSFIETVQSFLVGTLCLSSIIFVSIFEIVLKRRETGKW